MHSLLSKLAIRTNLLLRSHPSKYLFTDKILSHFIDPLEAPYLERNWNGDVWDVGASVGKYTTILAKHNPDYTVYAFEPNFNSLYYLAYRTQHLSNVIIVPNALTAHSDTCLCSIDPNINAPLTGPFALSLSLTPAMLVCGAPRFIKLDIEGGEYDLVTARNFLYWLTNTTILISWHRGVINVPGWKNTQLDVNLSLLEPL